jgi:hypothetical protein
VRGWRGIELTTGDYTSRRDFPISSDFVATCGVNPENRRNVLSGVVTPTPTEGGGIEADGAVYQIPPLLLLPPTLLPALELLLGKAIR